MKLRAYHVISLFCVCAGEVFSEPILPEKISYQEASTQQVIPFRDGVLVESDHYAADSMMYAQFDQKETTAFKVDGIKLLLDAERSPGGVLFFGLNEINNQVTCSLVMESAGARHETVELPEELRQLGSEIQHLDIPRLIGSNNTAALIVRDKVHWFDKEWRSRKLPKVPQFYHEFKPETFGEVHFLDGSTLYAGWNHGEWGGMLAAIDLSKAGAKWVHLSGKSVGDATGIPKNNPIHSIISPKEKGIWVATGLAHLGGNWRGLHHRDSDGKWHSLIDGDFEDDRGTMKFPSPSSIQGITADHARHIYVLSGEIGILKVTKDGIDHLIKHNFFSHASDRGDYIVGSYPEGLGIARNGDVFVSTNSFGVLAFRKKGDSWTARQIPLNKSR